jgi:hypothetical protein
MDWFKGDEKIFAPTLDGKNPIPISPLNTNRLETGCKHGFRFSCTGSTEEVFMTRGNRLSLAVEISAVALSASLILATDAKAEAPTPKLSSPEQTKICLTTEASSKAVSRPRMLTLSQFCPRTNGTAKSLRSCWESYLKNPEDYRNKLPTCAALESYGGDFSESEQTSASAIPPDMFHFLTHRIRRAR